MMKKVEKCQKNEKSTKKRRKKFENAQNLGKKGPLRQTDQNLSKNWKKSGPSPPVPRQFPASSPPLPGLIWAPWAQFGPQWAPFGPQWVPMGPKIPKIIKKL